MAGNGLDTEVQFLKGVGPQNSLLLAKLGLRTVRDVLFYFPRRYEDRRSMPPIMAVKPGDQVTLRGKILQVMSRPTKSGLLVRARLEDGTGSVELTWFNQAWIAKSLRAVKGEVLVFGTIRENGRRFEMTAPEWEAIDPEEDASGFSRLVPVYPLSTDVPQRLIRRAARAAVERYVDLVADPLPDTIRKELGVEPLAECVRQLHLPDSEERHEDARRRIVLEEFLYLQTTLQTKRREVRREVGISFPISQLRGGAEHRTNLFDASATLEQGGSLWDEVRRILPFELTGAQKRAIDEIWADMELGCPMNRLLQGDVGSGKTAVAACAMLAAVRCGYQAALMAPTEILADQHYVNLHQLFEPLGIRVVLMVGNQNAADRARARKQAANHQAQICVGTHALFQEGVEFARLGLAVIDEQHRFGVVQRAALRQKGVGNPDVLVMTATPIPRTLAMTLYGDLDLTILDELPPGRKPIKTHWKGPQDRDQVYASVRDLVSAGRQAYFVCPMISDSDKMQTQAAVDLHYRLGKEFPDLKIGLLHGQMKAKQKEKEMLAFRNGELHILVSTVVIEVGVDVPNASIMVVEDANRFGLSQLHQLRGRVGRGATQSYCVLIANATTEDARERLAAMVRTNDGFEIAEVDYRLRGAGDLLGTVQSGRGFTLADLLKDGKLLYLARDAAIRLLDRDPLLEEPENAEILRRVREQRSAEALVTIS